MPEINITPEFIREQVNSGQMVKITVENFNSQRYFIDREGTVYSLNRKPGRCVEPKAASDGHFSVILFDTVSPKRFRVCDLVCMSFMGSQRTIEHCKPIHINGDFADNSVKNLRWGTIQQERDLLRRIAEKEFYGGELGTNATQGMVCPPGTLSNEFEEILENIKSLVVGQEDSMEPEEKEHLIMVLHEIQKTITDSNNRRFQSRNNIDRSQTFSVEEE